MSKVLSVYILQNFGLIRKNLSVILGANEKFSVLDTFSCSKSFWETFRFKKSDIVVLDLGHHCISALELIKMIKKISPRTVVFVYTPREVCNDLNLALHSGADFVCDTSTKLSSIPDVLYNFYNYSFINREAIKYC